MSLALVVSTVIPMLIYIIIGLAIYRLRRQGSLRRHAGASQNLFFLAAAGEVGLLAILVLSSAEQSGPAVAAWGFIEATSRICALAAALFLFASSSKRAV